ncbi:hypothetical protein I4U23_006732 [Adineta vaga]|nr:hypothetical protein I4U23_006732 [Adineta vaga]
MYFPNPPGNILEIFNRDEWLCLFNHIFSNHPSFILFIVTSYLQTILTEAYRLSEVTPVDIDPKRMIESFQPLTRGQYPVFNKYPKFIINYQIQEKEKLRQEEMDYIRQRELNFEMFRERQHNMLHQQHLLKGAELRRLDDEIRKKAEERKDVLKSRIKSAELKALELETEIKILENQMLRLQRVKSSNGAPFDLDDLADIRERRTRLVDENLQSIAYVPTSVDAPTGI